ncbi:hydroxyacid dehydrogenase [Jiangella aurantiaca]|uniref:Hydroxyacid dehydrogenase n=1 Tax=Jiangella aurantiaca TaxID=2530373 RepID=A0A4R5A7H4_9ACTN|nr:NAD(P)-dependent oxidoreductase [Jiangella aurantiaca]TDD65562.1 hydroxyacid dehydrogenase [Jiangella aurantiaca]
MTTNDKPTPLVLVTSRSFGAGQADPEGILTGAGLRVVHGDPAHDTAALSPYLAAAAAWIAGAAPIRAEHFDLAPKLLIVARYGTGVDMVDLDAARARGIVVTNTPGANADAVAEHTLALLLASVRHVVEGDRTIRAGRSPRMVGRELGALTVGLVGVGHVGRAVARRLLALGATVAGSDPAVGPDELREIGLQWRSLDELVATCDVVSLHCPGGGSPVLGRDLLTRMRPGAIVVNTARPDVVDEFALAELLHAGRIGAAALDVLSSAGSPLLGAPRTILTPHTAGHTVQAVDRMGMAAAAEVVRVIVDGEAPRHPVRG